MGAQGRTVYTGAGRERGAGAGEPTEGPASLAAADPHARGWGIRDRPIDRAWCG